MKIDFSSLPLGWQPATLETIAAPVKNAIVDGPFGSNLKLSDYGPEGIPVLQGKNITGNKFVWSDVRFITPEKANQLARSKVEVGDILIVKIGSIGYSAIIDNLQGYPFAIIPANLAKLSPDKAKINPKFLVYYLGSNEIRNELINRSSKTAQPALSLSKIKSLPIPLPPLAEQERIVCLLDEAESLRKLRAQASARMEEFIPGLFHEMFGDPVASAYPVKNLGAVADVVSGIAKGRKFNGQKAVTVNYLRVANVQAGYLDLSEIKTIEALPEEVEALQVKVGDVLLTEGGDFDKLGRGAMLEVDLPNCIHQNHIFRARVYREFLTPDFLHDFLQTRQAKNYFLSCAKKTTNLASINLTQLRALPVPLPPLSLQSEFAQRVQEAREIQSRQAQSAERVEALYQSMLSRAFAGELQWPELSKR